MTRRGRTIFLSLAITAAAALTLTGVLLHLAGTPTNRWPSAVSTSAPSPYTGTTTRFTNPTAAQIAALPEARYDAVIPGLLTDLNATPSATTYTVYRIARNTALYGADKNTPVARLEAKNFLGEDTIIVATTIDKSWAKVLTPARQSLPSKNPAAPAQTAAWIRFNELIKVQNLTEHIVVSVSRHTVRIEKVDGAATESSTAGIGTAGTPTPTGVTGYLQARYLDPKQNQTVYPIGLTSLHSAAADEPFGGNDGGLIGIHFNPISTGTVSHGCIRLNANAIKAINQLPLGTPIGILK